MSLLAALRRLRQKNDKLKANTGNRADVKYFRRTMPVWKSNKDSELPHLFCSLRHETVAGTHLLNSWFHGKELTSGKGQPSKPVSGTDKFLNLFPALSSTRR